MAELVVRPLSPFDLPHLRQLHAIDTRVDSPPWDGPDETSLSSQALRSMPLVGRGTRMYVAVLDGLICATVTTRRQFPRYRRDVLSMAASEELMYGPCDDVRGVWTALLELAIREGGESGAKRLYASSEVDSVVYDGLRSASFEPYSRFWIVRLTMPSDRVAEPHGLRRHEESDVWSIHQLYHRVTPMGVQYAEALTSAAWERPPASLLDQLRSRSAPDTFVVETQDGVAAHCSVTKHNDGAVARLLISDELRHEACSVVMGAARSSGVRRGAPLRVIVPAYRSELMQQFEAAGGVAESERVALIRHTTAAAQIRSRAVAPLVDVAERVPRRVPTYLQEVTGRDVESGPAAHSSRMERMSS